MKTKKTIKAWAILNHKKNGIITVQFGSKPGFYNVGTWNFYAEKGDTDVIPCTISYSLPAKRKTK